MLKGDHLSIERYTKSQPFLTSRYSLENDLEQRNVNPDNESASERGITVGPRHVHGNFDQIEDYTKNEFLSKEFQGCIF